MVTISTAQKFQILYLNFKCLKCIVTTVSLLMLIKIRCNRKSQIFAKNGCNPKVCKTGPVCCYIREDKELY